MKNSEVEARLSNSYINWVEKGCIGRKPLQAIMKEIR
jgi:hypothetical protein